MSEYIGIKAQSIIKASNDGGEFSHIIKNGNVFNFSIPQYVVVSICCTDAII